MSYREVSYDELRQYCTPSKMAILDDLFNVIVSGFDSVDGWIDRCESQLPIVVNRLDEMAEN